VESHALFPKATPHHHQHLPTHNSQLTTPHHHTTTNISQQALHGPTKAPQNLITQPTNFFNKMVLNKMSSSQQHRMKLSSPAAGAPWQEHRFWAGSFSALEPCETGSFETTAFDTTQGLGFDTTMDTTANCQFQQCSAGPAQFENW
jgi:hypothetical protein